MRAFRADFLSSLTKVRESIGSNLIEREEFGVVHFVDEDEAEVVTTRVKKKVLIEVIGDEDEDEEKSPNKKSQMWNDFALLLCGMMETSDGIPSWSSKQCSDRAKEMLEECYMDGSNRGSNSSSDDDNGKRRAPLASDALDGERMWRDL